MLVTTAIIAVATVTPKAMAMTASSLRRRCRRKDSKMMRVNMIRTPRPLPYFERDALSKLLLLRITEKMCPLLQICRLNDGHAAALDHSQRNWIATPGFSQ